MKSKFEHVVSQSGEELSKKYKASKKNKKKGDEKTNTLSNPTEKMQNKSVEVSTKEEVTISKPQVEITDGGVEVPKDQIPSQLFKINNKEEVKKEETNKIESPVVVETEQPNKNEEDVSVKVSLKDAIKLEEPALVVTDGGASVQSASIPTTVFKINEGIVKSETVKEETVKEEVVKEEPVKKETVKEEVIKEEPVKKETAKEDIPDKKKTIVKENRVNKTKEDNYKPKGNQKKSIKVPSIKLDKVVKLIVLLIFSLMSYLVVISAINGNSIVDTKNQHTPTLFKDLISVTLSKIPNFNNMGSFESMNGLQVPSFNKQTVDNMFSKSTKKEEYNSLDIQSITEGYPVNYYNYVSIYDMRIETKQEFKELEKNPNVVFLHKLLIDLDKSNLEKIEINNNNYYINGGILGLAVITDSMEIKNKVEEHIEEIKVAIESNLKGKKIEDVKNKEAIEENISFIIERIIGEKIKVKQLMMLLPM